jgi:hypothetical protein
MFKLTLVALMLWSSVVPQQDASRTFRKVERLEDVKVGELQVNDVLLSEFLLKLSDNTKIAFCVENRKDETVDSLGGLRLNLEIRSADDVQTVLQRIHAKYPIVRWRIEEGIVVISAADIQSDPLNGMLGPFSISATVGELVRYLNFHVTGLLADTLEVAGMYPTKTAYSLMFDSDAKASQVLSRLTRDSGIRWYASIRDHGMSLEIPDGPNGQPVKTTTGRVSLMFGRGPIPLLVR